MGLGQPTWYARRMSNDPDRPRPSPGSAEVFRIEAEAEAEQKRLAAEGAANIVNKCPECGALGSVEEFEDGEQRCVDCDLVVGATRKIGGMGRN